MFFHMLRCPILSVVICEGSCCIELQLANQNDLCATAYTVLQCTTRVGVLEEVRDMMSKAQSLRLGASFLCGGLTFNMITYKGR